MPSSLAYLCLSTRSIRFWSRGPSEKASSPRLRDRNELIVRAPGESRTGTRSAVAYLAKGKARETEAPKEFPLSPPPPSPTQTKQFISTQHLVVFI